MSGAREAVLRRVREAAAQGNLAGGDVALPPRAAAGYQGSGAKAVQYFCEQLAVAGGKSYLVPNVNAAAERVLELVRAKEAKRVLLGRGAVIDQLLLPEKLRAIGVKVDEAGALDRGHEREVFFGDDIGITGVAYALAETGSLVVAAAPVEPRSLSLLPPVHIAVIGQTQLLPDLFDLFAELEPQKANLPSCMALITGPSKTGDIELKLVTGVHGPGELHVIVVTE